MTRKLDLADSVWIGLGAMLGAGVFAALGPATRAAGSAMLIGLAVAAVVAYCNARSSAQLAALYPESGGTYVYARERLGEKWGLVAGWAFVLGKTASLSAMALTFGNYVAPAAARPIGVAAVVLLTGVNLLGIEKTAALTRVLVVIVLGALGLVVAGALLGGSAHASRLTPHGASVLDVLKAAAFMFFAFAGYARIATLGGEVVDPERTIPKAIDRAFAIALAVYALTAIAALSALGPRRVGLSPAPLADAVPSEIEPFVRVGAAVAVASVLLSLLAGVGRTAFAMLRVELDVLQIVVAAVVVVTTLVFDLRGAIGFSSFCVLIYYSITNASAWTLGKRLVPGLGLAGCLALAVSLPL